MSNFFIFAIVFSMLVISSYGFHEKDTPADAFKSFKDVFKKNYKDSDHENKAFGYFKENRDKIIAHNKQHDRGQVTYRLAVNYRIDWSPEEHQKVNNYRAPTKEEIEKMPQHRVQGPKQQSRRAKRQIGPILGYQPFDWRDYGRVNPIRDQGSCGTCQTFAKVDTVAGAYAIYQNTSAISYSVQAVIDCSFANFSAQNTPELMGDMFIMKNGIQTETDYPYTANSANYCVNPWTRNVTVYTGSCNMWSNGKPLQQPFVDRNRTYSDVCAGCYPPSEAGMVDGIVHGGPMYVALNANCLGFSYFGSGIIYNSNCAIDYNHAVQLVGVGVQSVFAVNPNMTCQTQQIPYYILKNSWGTGWGESGYGKVSVGTKELGLGGGGSYVTVTVYAPPAAPAPTVDYTALYYITNVKTGTVMDTTATCTLTNCSIVGNAKQSTQTQLWKIQPYPSNTSYYTITNVAQNLCLSLPSNGTQMTLATCGAGPVTDGTLFSLRWNGTVTATSGDGWDIIPKTQTKNSINLNGGSSANNTPIITYWDFFKMNNFWLFVQ